MTLSEQYEVAPVDGQPVAWEPPPPRSVKKRGGSAWWTPLLGPFMLLLIGEVGSIGEKPHVVRPNFFGDLLTLMIAVAILAGPAFYSGVLYARHRREAQ
jgi:hypothetical protein